MSLVVWTSTGITCTPIDGAKAWIEDQVSDSGGDGGISKDCRARHSRRDFLEHLQPFPAHPKFERCESSGVSHRLCQACYIAAADWIGDIYEHDWHGPARLLQCPRDRAAQSQDDFRSECD